MMRRGPRTPITSRHCCAWRPSDPARSLRRPASSPWPRSSASSQSHRERPELPSASDCGPEIRSGEHRLLPGPDLVMSHLGAGRSAAAGRPALQMRDSQRCNPRCCSRSSKRPAATDPIPRRQLERSVCSGAQQRWASYTLGVWTRRALCAQWQHGQRRATIFDAATIDCALGAIATADAAAARTHLRASPRRCARATAWRLGSASRSSNAAAAPRSPGESLFAQGTTPDHVRTMRAISKRANRSIPPSRCCSRCSGSGRAPGNP